MNQYRGLRFEAPGEVLRRRWSLLVGAAALFVTSLVLAQVGAPGWGVLVERVLAACLLVAFASKVYRSSAKGVVHADATGLRLGDEVVATRSGIATAFLLAPEGSEVRIVRPRAFSIDVRLESEEKARALLTALGLGIGQSIATFSARTGGFRRDVVLAASTVVGSGALALLLSEVLQGKGYAATTMMALGIALPLFFLQARVRVDVGSDGVLLRGVIDKRFVSYAALTKAMGVGANAIVLMLRSGKILRLSVEGGLAEQSQLRDALLERIEEARSAFVESQGMGSAEALVAPGGREAERWVREVRSLAGASDYRQPRLDADRLWRVVDDATAPAATRAGAALALSTLDDPSRTRMRVAAEACAEPRLRVALRRVADGASDDELREVLAPLLESKS